MSRLPTEPEAPVRKVNSWVRLMQHASWRNRLVWPAWALLTALVTLSTPALGDGSGPVLSRLEVYGNAPLRQPGPIVDVLLSGDRLFVLSSSVESAELRSALEVRVYRLGPAGGVRLEGSAALGASLEWWTSSILVPCPESGAGGGTPIDLLVLSELYHCDVASGILDTRHFDETRGPLPDGNSKKDRLGVVVFDDSLRTPILYCPSPASGRRNRVCVRWGPYEDAEVHILDVYPLAPNWFAAVVGTENGTEFWTISEGGGVRREEISAHVLKGAQVVGDGAVVGQTGGKLCLFRRVRESWELIWDLELGPRQMLFGDCVLDASLCTLVVGVYDGSVAHNWVWGIDYEHGRLLWRQSVPKFGARLAVTRGHELLVAGGSVVQRLSLRDGSFRGGPVHWETPAVLGASRRFVATFEPGQLLLWERATGRVRNRWVAEVATGTEDGRAVAFVAARRLLSLDVVSGEATPVRSFPAPHGLLGLRRGKGGAYELLTERPAAEGFEIRRHRLGRDGREVEGEVLWRGANYPLGLEGNSKLGWFLALVGGCATVRWWRAGTDFEKLTDAERLWHVGTIVSRGERGFLVRYGPAWFGHVRLVDSRNEGPVLFESRSPGAMVGIAPDADGEWVVCFESPPMSLISTRGLVARGSLIHVGCAETVAEFALPADVSPARALLTDDLRTLLVPSSNGEVRGYAIPIAEVHRHQCRGELPPRVQPSRTAWILCPGPRGLRKLSDQRYLQGPDVQLLQARLVEKGYDHVHVIEVNQRLSARTFEMISRRCCRPAEIHVVAPLVSGTLFLCLADDGQWVDLGAVAHLTGCPGGRIFVWSASRDAALPAHSRRFIPDGWSVWCLKGPAPRDPCTCLRRPGDWWHRVWPPADNTRSRAGR